MSESPFDPVRKALLEIEAQGALVVWRIDQIDAHNPALRDAYCEWLAQEMDCVISYSLEHPSVRVMVDDFVIDEMEMLQVPNFLRAMSQNSYCHKRVGMLGRTILEIKSPDGQTWQAT